MKTLISRFQGFHKSVQGFSAVEMSFAVGIMAVVTLSVASMYFAMTSREGAVGVRQQETALFNEIAKVLQDRTRCSSNNVLGTKSANVGTDLSPVTLLSQVISTNGTYNGLTINSIEISSSTATGKKDYIDINGTPASLEEVDVTLVMVEVEVNRGEGAAGGPIGKIVVPTYVAVDGSNNIQACLGIRHEQRKATCSAMGGNYDDYGGYFTEDQQKCDTCTPQGGIIHAYSWICSYPQGGTITPGPGPATPPTESACGGTEVWHLMIGSCLDSSWPDSCSASDSNTDCSALGSGHRCAISTTGSNEIDSSCLALYCECPGWPTQKGVPVALSPSPTPGPTPGPSPTPGPGPSPGPTPGPFSGTWQSGGGACGPSMPIPCGSPAPGGSCSTMGASCGGSNCAVNTICAVPGTCGDEYFQCL